MATNKVYVYPVEGRAKEIGTIEQLVKAAGCQLVCTNQPATAFEECVKGADTVVILICAATMTDAAVVKLVDLASHLGRRVVGVWAPEVSSDVLPPALKRHGDAVICLTSEEIAASVCGQESVWTTPRGGRRPRQKTPRHKGH